jgi:hypothetical protein
LILSQTEAEQALDIIAHALGQIAEC